MRDVMEDVAALIKGSSARRIAFVQLYLCHRVTDCLSM